VDGHKKSISCFLKSKGTSQRYKKFFTRLKNFLRIAQSVEDGGAEIPPKAPLVAQKAYQSSLPYYQISIFVHSCGKTLTPVLG
jgi:hypothetical protein